MPVDDLALARAGDGDAFARLVAPHRPDLLAHCYRMLGSAHDAEDAVQEALLGAWKGLAGFEGRSSLRSWLYRIATNAAIRVSSRRPNRRLAAELGPSMTTTADLGEPMAEAVWIEPFPDADVPSGRAGPEARYDQRESVELAFVAALQRLPAKQRAVVILRDVLGFPAAAVADSLDLSVAAVNSALQRGRDTLDARPGGSQQAARRALGTDGESALVGAFVAAWEAADIDRLVALLAEDARLAMPPLPARFVGRDAVRAFFAERAFAFPWRLVPTTANGQVAVVAYMSQDGGRTYPYSGIEVLAIRDGRIAEITAFIDPHVRAFFPQTDEFAPPAVSYRMSAPSDGARTEED